MAEAFMGYVLPWGQMSYWGAQVIISLFNSIPFIGETLFEWILGDFAVGDAALNRFFALHVIALPLILVVLVFLHIVALHAVGSNNPDGIEIKNNKDENNIPKDGIPFHPYYSVKDIVGVVVFLICFSAIVFFAPTLNGYFLENANFIEANPLQTPDHIAPLWYLTPFYSILRAIPPLFLSQFPGVFGMFAALLILFALPWLDRSKVKSIRYRPWQYKLALVIFVISFIMLGWLGMKPVESPAWYLYTADMMGMEVETALYVILARIFTITYFGFFILMPYFSSKGQNKKEPTRTTR
jgi:ubiquinol-cytochrome c reductase cytochrome b subunit